MRRGLVTRRRWTSLGPELSINLARGWHVKRRPAGRANVSGFGLAKVDEPAADRQAPAAIGGMIGGLW